MYPPVRRSADPSYFFFLSLFSFFFSMEHFIHSELNTQPIQFHLIKFSESISCSNGLYFLNMIIIHEPLILCMKSWKYIHIFSHIFALFFNCPPILYEYLMYVVFRSSIKMVKIQAPLVFFFRYFFLLQCETSQVFAFMNLIKNHFSRSTTNKQQ